MCLIVHPSQTPVTVLPASVHLPLPGVTLKPTNSPELDLALTEPVPPTTTVGGWPKVMIWVILGMKLLEDADSPLQPTLLWAATVQVEFMQFSKPVTRMGVVVPVPSVPKAQVAL